MPTFKATVRTKKDLNAVYIRISHKSRTDYMPTGMIVHKSGLRKGEIADHTILANCAIRIKKYVEKLNRTDVRKWTVGEIRKFLMEDSEDISFIGFAEKYIRKMVNDGRTKSAANYAGAVNSLKRYIGSEEISFSEITSRTIRKWIESLSETARAKNMYPIIIKKLFEEGCLEYNDHDRDIMRIRNQPFKTVRIPHADVPAKRYAPTDAVRRLANMRPDAGREELAQDVLRMALMLAGINTVDLYGMEKSAFSNGKLCYNRRKTEGKRRDRAYFEISVMDELRPLFVKYAGGKRLFNFCERYATADTFSRAVNTGLKSLCRRANADIECEAKASGIRMVSIPEITAYWLRHTWATVAQNKCGASTELVGFCLNHTSAHKTTEGYIQKDFSPVDRMNRQVIDFIFETAEKGNER